MVVQHLTPTALAERLSVSTRTLAAWRADGTGPTYVRAGAQIRYPVADVLIWEARNGVGPVDDEYTGPVDLTGLDPHATATLLALASSIGVPIEMVAEVVGMTVAEVRAHIATIVPA
ncbi:helix-turn-helix domain-containing protein [Cellulomonas sp. PSBB021]|uniref:helix-turn-helix domain-containing protein n=1 Tax=Cellulomonas sp. PSBB021 TaxID=2003551 RepID=UPI000B8DA418|nr:helix-turn-helix domain-containing protein [Cellulomonas sp. PSBB021]ASR54193.1 hypothetical protein CBP52_02455 [Cellulomonas sp. PSBB021]